MMGQFINFVTWPPRAQCNPDQYLWKKEITLVGSKYRMRNLEASVDMFCLILQLLFFIFGSYFMITIFSNFQRSHHYLPSPSLKIFLFLVLYVAMEKSGFRAEANEIAVILLPSISIVFFQYSIPLLLFSCNIRTSMSAFH